MKMNIPFPKHREHLNFSHGNKGTPDYKKLISQCKNNGKCPVSEVIDYGGAGSGNFGHKGRPGIRGGSVGGGGTSGGSSGGGQSSVGTAQRTDSGTQKTTDIERSGNTTGGGPAITTQTIKQVAKQFPGGSGTPIDDLDVTDEEAEEISRQIESGEIEPDDGSISDAIEELRNARGISDPDIVERGSSGEGDDFTPDELGVVPEILETPETSDSADQEFNNGISITGSPTIPDFFPSSPQEETVVRKMINNGDVEDSEESIKQTVRDMRGIRKQLLQIPTDIPGKNSVGTDIMLGDTLSNDEAGILTGQINSGEIKSDTNSIIEALGNIRGEAISIPAIPENTKLNELSTSIETGDIDTKSLAKTLRDVTMNALATGPGLAIDAIRKKSDSGIAEKLDNAINSADVPAETLITLELMKGSGLTNVPFFANMTEGLLEAALSKAPDKIKDIKKQYKSMIGDLKGANETFIKQVKKDIDVVKKDIDDPEGFKDRMLKEANEIKAKAAEFLSNMKDVFTGDQSLSAVMNDLMTNELTTSQLKRPTPLPDTEDRMSILETSLAPTEKLTKAESNFLRNMVDGGEIAPGNDAFKEILDILRQAVEDNVNNGGIEDTEKAREIYIDLLDNRNIGPDGRLGSPGNPRSTVPFNNTENLYKLAESCPVTADSGCPLFLSTFAENENKDIGWMEVFEFDDSNVLGMLVKNFKKLKSKLSPPIKLGHDESQKLVQNSGFPSAGWITGLKRKGTTNKLLAYFSNVPNPIVKLIESGAYKRISAEIYNNYVDPDTHKAFGPTMRAVSILGADVPRIKTLKDLAIIYNSDGLPYKTFQKEEIGMDVIMQMIEALKEELSKLAGLDKAEDTEQVQEAVEALQEKFGEAADAFTALSESQNKEINKLLKANKKKVTLTGNDPDTLKLSETIDTQASLITQLSESVKTIGSELKGAQDHILESKKASVKATLSKNFSPALVEKAMPLINFSEGEDKVVDLLTAMQKMQEESALFLSEPLDIEQQEFNSSMGNGNSEDKLHNEVTALSEKDNCSYKVAFDKLMVLKSK
jgi:hypothetical protein